MGDVEQEVHFIILSKDAGGIIGRQGNQVRQMRDESGAEIGITGSSSVERILNIRGTVKSIQLSVTMVRSHLLPKLTFSLKIGV